MRILFFLVLSIVFIGGNAWAQKIPAVRPGVAALRHNRAVIWQLNQEAPLVLGNYKIGFSSPHTKPYAPYLQQRFFANRLDHAAYPELARRNDRRVLAALRNFERQATRFETDLPHITPQIRNDIFTGKVPYGQYLPQDIDVLYIGEIHDEMRVQEEIVSLVRQLPSIYPGRTIYLAAELIPTSLELTAEENIILTLDDLAERLDIAAPINSIRVVTAALDAQIPLYGLEDEMALFIASTPRKQPAPTDEQFDNYAMSLEGMNFRNRLFARKIRQLQVYDPGALIVVYGGIDHMAYHNSSALPSLVKGKSFVVQVTVPSALGGSNPLFTSLRLNEPLRQSFKSSASAKLVEYWETPTSYNRLLGNDLTVIVHE